MPRRLTATAVAVVLAPVLAAATGLGPTSLARLVDTATVTASVSADTLDPPTSLAATGGSSVGLSWTATVDTYASGYDVLRGTASGGPYSVVKSVSPRTTTSTSDAPASNGTYFYVLRSVFQSWTSVNSNQASATYTATGATGFHACTAASNAADSGGDGDGYETTPGNACATDAAVANDTNSGTNTTMSCTDAGKDRHRWWDFGLGVPGTVTSVNGIEVQLVAYKGNNSSNAQICAQLSWDGGTTWTTPLASAGLTTVSATYALGGPANTWGRTWSGSNFSNANFRVRLIDMTDKANQDVRLDSLAVQVTYTP
jgi:hypothetical protein